MHSRQLYRDCYVVYALHPRSHWTLVCILYTLHMAIQFSVVCMHADLASAVTDGTQCDLPILQHVLSLTLFAHFLLMRRGESDVERCSHLLFRSSYVNASEGKTSKWEWGWKELGRHERLASQDVCTALCECMCIYARLTMHTLKHG